MRRSTKLGSRATPLALPTANASCISARKKPRNSGSATIGYRRLDRRYSPVETSPVDTLLVSAMAAACVADAAALNEIVGGFTIVGQAPVLSGNLNSLEADISQSIPAQLDIYWSPTMTASLIGRLGSCVTR